MRTGRTSLIALLLVAPAACREPAAQPAMRVTAGDPGNGARLIRELGCGGCHTLAAAGVVGNIDEQGSVAPDLDEAKASYDEIVEVVTNGRGAMPSFEGELTPKDIRDVAAYVSSVAGK